MWISVLLGQNLSLLRCTFAMSFRARGLSHLNFGLSQWIFDMSHNNSTLLNCTFGRWVTLAGAYRAILRAIY